MKIKTHEQKVEIFERVMKGESTLKVAESFGVTDSCICVHFHKVARYLKNRLPKGSRDFESYKKTSKMLDYRIDRKFWLERLELFKKTR